MLRRWLAPAVILALVAGLAWAVGRLLPRSPILILLLCALAVLVMKLVEHRVRQWFRRWDQQARDRAGRPPSPRDG